MTTEAGARLLRMLEELRADAKAGFPNRSAPWRRREPQAIADQVEDEAEPEAEQEATALSLEAEEELVDALEAELLRGAAPPDNDSEEAAGPIMGDLLTAIDHAIDSEQLLADLDREIWHALKAELRQSGSKVDGD